MRPPALFILLFILSASPLNAQFLHIEIPVETEISASIQQRLALGNYQSGSGSHLISLNGSNAGVYSLTSYKNQLIGVRVPEVVFLPHVTLKDSIKLNIKAAYNNKGINNTELSIPFKGITAFKINAENKGSAFWERAYIYLYGMLHIGTVPEGLYRGEVTLTIHYW